MRLVALLALCATGLSAHALERITLRTGFAYDCTRHEPIEGGHVRLYIDKDGSNYVDLSAEQIASVDVLPDPPPPPVVTVAVAPPANVDVRELLSTAGEKHNIDVDLLASVVRAESGGRSRAVSRTGAQGLMQLMPGTAHQLGVQDAFQPDQNINGGTAYLDALLTRYHDNVVLALAAYNAGPGAVDRYHGVPPYRETRQYVTRVVNEFKRRKAAAARQVKLAQR
ncbi:lytic transglycosylase domain-containing protein [Granulicella cerasi]|uniref:Lytic transglycosylase domain-containing protein n=1 Tax=Granulicella cerasi TaxID=741063 RepID=A0ABW1Z8Z6_9BACT|nr:lytic transglycosylase domain-containing protein [Granulicella cerasi]